MAQQKTTETQAVITLNDLMKLEYTGAMVGILNKRKVHSLLSGKNASKLRGRGLDFEEVRKYVRGDDIRKIDWKVTARTKIPHTKVFNEEKERPVFTVVDQTGFMFFGSEVYVKSVVAAKVAAITGFRTLKIGDRFGGIVFNDESYEHIKPKRSRVAVMRFLEAVVKYNEQLPKQQVIKSNVDRLNEMLKRTHMAITHDYVVSIISDFSDMDQDTIQHLINLSMHNDVILVHVVDQLDQQLPDTKMILTDGEYQIRWDGKKNSNEQKFEQAYQDVMDELQEKLRRYNIAIMALNTKEDVTEQMKDILGLQGKK